MLIYGDGNRNGVCLCEWWELTGQDSNELSRFMAVFYILIEVVNTPSVYNDQSPNNA